MIFTQVQSRYKVLINVLISLRNTYHLQKTVISVLEHLQGAFFSHQQ